MEKQTSRPCPFGANTEILMITRSKTASRDNVSSEGSESGSRASVGTSHITTSSSYGTCFLASTLPKMRSPTMQGTLDTIIKERLNALEVIRQKRLKEIELILEDRQERLKAAGCPKWKLRIDGWVSRRIVCAECKYADGRPHPL